MESYKLTLHFTHTMYCMHMNKKFGNHKAVGYYDINLLLHGVFILRNQHKHLSPLLTGELYCGMPHPILKA